MASGDTFETSSDLNFIPATLVNRVDVLTKNASSAYGADAMAGSNFSRHEFEGSGAR
jgi:outer membrane receptor for ferrienterochelin and colicin